MDSTEQRKVIAEFMGWRLVHEHAVHGELCGYYRNQQNELIGTFEVPDYPNDLNAMHEVEAELERRELDRDWVEEMWGIVRPDKDKHQVYRAFPMMHATAAQRAQAAYQVITQHQRQEQEQQQKEG